VFPRLSGKREAGLWVLKELGVQDPKSEAAMLCDDDNDLGLASAVGVALIPQCTSPSVAAAAAAAEQTSDSSATRFYVAAVGGCLGTEECLREALELAAAS